VADAVLAISPYMAARARAYGVADDRITLTPSGLEPVEIGLGPGAPEESGSDASKAPLRLLYAGRLAVEKGVVVLLAACQLLRDRGTRYSLELIGDGTLRPALERRARELGVSDRVRFLGSVPRQQLGAHYRRADLVCMPSLDEPFGAVAVEALMAGTPVVASEVGGLPFVVRHGENGLLVPPDEPATLAGALALLDQDRTRLASLRRAAHASVRSRFSWDHLGETVRGAVRAALAAPRTGPEGAAAPRRALADGS
jgi:glycosyltransferase involved in cell wall biosynthesis